MDINGNIKPCEWDSMGISGLVVGMSIQCPTVPHWTSRRRHQAERSVCPKFLLGHSTSMDLYFQILVDYMIIAWKSTSILLVGYLLAVKAY